MKNVSTKAATEALINCFGQYFFHFNSFLILL